MNFKQSVVSNQLSYDFINAVIKFKEFLLFVVHFLENGFGLFFSFTQVLFHVE